MKIPDIDFNQKRSPIAGIELIALDELRKRQARLDLTHSPSEPHRIMFHALIYISQGQGAHFIDFNRYPFQTGCFIFVNKHQVHAYDFENQPLGYAIIFTDEFLDEIRTSIRAPVFKSSHLLTSYFPVMTINQELKNTSESLLAEIDKEARNASCDRLIIQLLFTSLLLRLSRERPRTFKKDLSEARVKKFMHFIALVEENFSVTRDASAYADRLHMTYKSLNQICKLASSQTAKQLIDAHTILEAKRRLAIESIQVKQLAYDLGFDEVTNFIKYFKKHVLLTPSQFQNSVHSQTG
ncbi:MAG: helix-turn-helix transcriptional regulator [Amphritea sp.]